MKKVLIFVLPIFVATAIMLALLESTVRLFFPEINHQDTQLSLFQEGAFGKSAGWRPNSQGESFGETVLIDNQGFRKMRSPEKFDSSWVVLGDSVTFGVGVKTEDTFVQLIQDQFPHVKLWNTSVVGYSLYNYKDVLDYFLRHRSDIEKVIMFFCLNDIYGNLALKPSHLNLKDKVRSFLRRRSKLFMWLKNTFTDRSKAYAVHDIKLYSENRKELHDALDVLGDMNTALLKKGIDFLIIVLPYEYQLRAKEARYLAPQNMLLDYLSNKRIRSLSAYDYFSSKNVDSKKFYLYADPMHLSVYGHRMVFEFVQRELLRPLGA